MKASAWMWLAVAVLVTFAGTALRVAVGPADGIRPYLIDYAQYAILIGILLGVPSLRAAYRVPDEEKEPTDKFLWVARTVALAVGMVVVLVPSRLFIFDSLNELFPDSAYFLYPRYANFNLRVFDLTIGTFLLAFSEELLWRRALMEMLLKRGWPRLTILFASAIPFACVHWYGGIAHVAYIVPFGILLALIYLEYRSLWMLVGIHYLVDFCIFGLFDPRMTPGI